jgi:hypothetical protein
MNSISRPTLYALGELPVEPLVVALDQVCVALVVGLNLVLRMLSIAMSPLMIVVFFL